MAVLFHCKVYVSVREGNPRALADAEQTHTHTITCLLHHHVLALCTLRGY